MLNRFRLLISAMIASFFLLSEARAEKSLRLVTEDFAPFGYLEDNRLIGIGPEIVSAMKDVIKRNDLQIEVLPWKRAYTLAKDQPNIGIFSLARNDHREPLFKWVGPLYTMRDYLFARQDFDGDINTLEDTEKYGRILLQSSGPQELEFKDKGFTNYLGIFNVEKMLPLLLSQRGEFLILPDVAFIHQLNTLGLSPESFKPVKNLGQIDFYLGFSAETSDEVVSEWAGALDKIKADGTWQSIIDRFMLLPSQ